MSLLPSRCRWGRSRPIRARPRGRLRLSCCAPDAMTLVHNTAVGSIDPPKTVHHLPIHPARLRACPRPPHTHPPTHQPTQTPPQGRQDPRGDPAGERGAARCGEPRAGRAAAGDTADGKWARGAQDDPGALRPLFERRRGQLPRHRRPLCGRQRRAFLRGSICAVGGLFVANPPPLPAAADTRNPPQNHSARRWPAP